MSDEKQAVVDDTKVSAQPDTAVDSARDDGDVEALLAQFEQETKPAVSPPEPATKDEPDVKSLSDRLQRFEQAENKRAVSNLVDDIRGDVPKEFMDDDEIESWLESQVRKDPRLAQAFMLRDMKPQAWEPIKSGLAKSLSKKLDRLRALSENNQANEDRNMVAHAVRGASAKITAEPPPQLGHMSDNELREYTRKNFGFV